MICHMKKHIVSYNLVQKKIQAKRLTTVSCPLLVFKYSLIFRPSSSVLVKKNLKNMYIKPTHSNSNHIFKKSIQNSKTTIWLVGFKFFAHPNPINSIISWVISWTISWQIIPYKTESFFLVLCYLLSWKAL